MRARGILAGLFLAASLGGTPGEGATLHLSVPSEGECLLAATRDLYILGTLDRQGRSPSQEPLDLRVRLFRLGEAAALRTVTASVDATGLTPRGAVRVDYLKDLAARKLGNLYAPSDDPVLRCPPPDLLGDPSIPGSLEDPRNKGVVTEHTFAALLQGGVTGDFDTAYRRVLSRDLEEGTYRLLVEALGRSGSVAASADRILRLGTVPDKVLARFSPPEHLAAVTAFAAARGYRIYRDPFPGYWDCGSPSSPEPLRGEAPYFAEILPRWRANDALEYRGGTGPRGDLQHQPRQHLPDRGDREPGGDGAAGDRLHPLPLRHRGGGPERGPGRRGSRSVGSGCWCPSPPGTGWC